MQKRKSLRLPHYDYRHPGAYFITLVTHQRKHYFGEIEAGILHPSPAATTVCRCWRTLPDRFTTLKIDQMVLMPNHLHAILWITQGTGPGLNSLVALCKGSVSKTVRSPRPLWQRGFYDRVIRNSAELTRIRDYIRQNPLQWELDKLNSAE